MHNHMHMCTHTYTQTRPAARMCMHVHMHANIVPARVHACWACDGMVCKCPRKCLALHCPTRPATRCDVQHTTKEEPGRMHERWGSVPDTNFRVKAHFGTAAALPTTIWSLCCRHKQLASITSVTGTLAGKRADPGCRVCSPACNALVLSLRERCL